MVSLFFFFNDTATTEIYTLSLHDALPILLVLGANSGVGIAAIQIAKLFHARVITTAGDEQKMQKARELGADYVINHYQQKISEEVRRITNKEGCDIVLEHVGAATWEESMKALKP